MCIRDSITGGGLIENIPRILPPLLGVQLERKNWPQTELFAWAQKTAGIDDFEMNRTFNNGIGMVIIIEPEQAVSCMQTLKDLGEYPHHIGEVIDLEKAQQKGSLETTNRVFIK